jgi:hypothetical protein
VLSRPFGPNDGASKEEEEERCGYLDQQGVQIWTGSQRLGQPARAESTLAHRSPQRFRLAGLFRSRSRAYGAMDGTSVPTSSPSSAKSLLRKKKMHILV